MEQREGLGNGAAFERREIGRAQRGAGSFLHKVPLLLHTLVILLIDGLDDPVAQAQAIQVEDQRAAAPEGESLPFRLIGIDRDVAFLGDGDNELVQQVAIRSDPLGRMQGVNLE